MGLGQLIEATNNKVTSQEVSPSDMNALIKELNPHTNVNILTIKRGDLGKVEISYECDKHEVDEATIKQFYWMANLKKQKEAFIQ